MAAAGVVATSSVINPRFAASVAATIAVTAPRPGACGTWYPSHAPSMAVLSAAQAATPPQRRTSEPAGIDGERDRQGDRDDREHLIGDRHPREGDEDDQHAQAPAAEAEHDR